MPGVKPFVFIYSALLFLLSCKKQTTQITSGSNTRHELKFSDFRSAVKIHVIINSKEDKEYYDNNTVFYLAGGDKVNIKYTPGTLMGDTSYKGNFLKIILNDVIVRQYDCLFTAEDSCKADFSITI